MRLRNIPRADAVIQESPFVLNAPEEWKGKWKDYFSNENPVAVEIGMGKGTFLTQMAKKYPEINFIGIERYTSVLLRAVEKLERAEETLPNLIFLRTEAEKLEDFFAPGEVDVIYLNFSDPWPKDRHHKRRLVSREHLALYEKVLAADGVVEFKTDNVGLFDFALEEIPASGWELVAMTRDLHQDPMGEGNIMTEYEEKFSAKGQKIQKLVCKRGCRS